MVCEQFGGVIICSPTKGRLSREHRKCELGICTTTTSRIVVSQGSPWYGADYFCVDCGDSWDGEGWRFKRPFERAWRKKAIARYEAKWERACECPVNYDEDGYALACPTHPESV